MAPSSIRIRAARYASLPNVNDSRVVTYESCLNQCFRNVQVLHYKREHVYVHQIVSPMDGDGVGQQVFFCGNVPSGAEIGYGCYN